MREASTLRLLLRSYHRQRVAAHLSASKGHKTEEEEPGVAAVGWIALGPGHDRLVMLRMNNLLVLWLPDWGCESYLLNTQLPDGLHIPLQHTGSCRGCWA